MDKQMLMDVASVLLLQIHVVTGWVVPAADPREKGNAKLDILIDQLSRKLSESYAFYNAEEIMYAFRNTKAVKDWGKNINLSLIDEVMESYINTRRELNRIEVSKWRPSKEEEAKKPKITDEDFIESCYQGYVHSKDFMKIPLLAWKSLESKIIMTDQEKQVIRDEVKKLFGVMNSDACRLMAIAKYFETKYKNDGEVSTK